ARKVLALTEDGALVPATLAILAGFIVGFRKQNGDTLNTKVFAVAAIKIDVEVCEEGAFGNSARGEVAGKYVEVFVGERAVFRERNGDIADAARAGQTDRGSGGLAELVRGQGLRFAEADDHHTIGLESVQTAQNQRLSEGCFELASSNPRCCGLRERVRDGQQCRGGRVVFAGSDIDREDNEQRCSKA